MAKVSLAEWPPENIKWLGQCSAASLEIVPRLTSVWEAMMQVERSKSSKERTSLTFAKERAFMMMMVENQERFDATSFYIPHSNISCGIH